MAGIWWFGGQNWIDFTAGSYVGTGAFTMGVILNPADPNDRLFSTLAGSTKVQEIFLDAGAFFGTNDFSSGFSAQPITVGQWYVALLTKAAGAAPYRFHVWPYASAGTGTMVHGVAAGAANHADIAGPITGIRVGSALSQGANGTHSLFALWDRALSDAECDTLKTKFLQKWADLNPKFLCPMNTWNGTTGAVDKAGTATFISLTGGVDPLGNEPPIFDYTLSGGGQASTVATVADNIRRLGAAQFGPGLSVMDYYNLSLAGDIQKFGFGYAINKNFGGGVGPVTKNLRTHFTATATETTSDAAARYFAAAATLP